jgi:hypothetical protein
VLQLTQLTGFLFVGPLCSKLELNFISGRVSCEDNSVEFCNELREEDGVSKLLRCASDVVDIKEKGVIGSLAVALLEFDAFKGMGDSNSPGTCWINVVANVRRGLAFNKRESSNANRSSSSMDDRDIIN